MPWLDTNEARVDHRLGCCGLPAVCHGWTLMRQELTTDQGVGGCPLCIGARCRQATHVYTDMYKVGYRGTVGRHGADIVQGRLPAEGASTCLCASRGE